MLWGLWIHTELENLRNRIFETMTERQAQEVGTLQQCIKEWEEVQTKCDRALVSCTRQREVFLTR